MAITATATGDVGGGSKKKQKRKKKKKQRNSVRHDLKQRGGENVAGAERSEESSRHLANDGCAGRVKSTLQLHAANDRDGANFGESGRRPAKPSSTAAVLEPGNAVFGGEMEERVKRGVQFVFPRGYGREPGAPPKKKEKPMPYFFSKQQQPSAVADSETFRKGQSHKLPPRENSVDQRHVAQRGGLVGETKMSTAGESIDDILFPNRKGKRWGDSDRGRETPAPGHNGTESGNDARENDRNKVSQAGPLADLDSKRKVSIENAQESKVVRDSDEKENGRKHDVARSLKTATAKHMKTLSRIVSIEEEAADDLHDQRQNHTSDKGQHHAGKSPEMEKRPKDGKLRARALSEDESEESRNMYRQLSGLSVEDAIRDNYGRRPRLNSTDGELNLPRRGLCDEHMVLESHRWDLNRLCNGRKDKRNRAETEPRGLQNLGNTCFLNATLQCLAYLPPFCQCVAALPSEAHNNPNFIHNAGNKKKIPHGQRITMMLRSLLRVIHGLDEQDRGAFAPRAIVRAVPTLGGSGRGGGHKFRPGRQEDAHEFLVHLLDAMHNGELKAAGIDQNTSGWRDRLPIPRLDETTLIHRIFGGYLRSQVCCTNCGYKSNTYDPFLDLALEVSKKSSNSVSSAFSEFTRKETLDSANRWKCSGCKKRVCATKQLTVFRPPLSLCIQLKRFSFGGGGIFGGLMHYAGGRGYGHWPGKGMGMHGQGGSKITKPIEFPANLRLPLSDGRKCEYALTGLVMHVGGSATSGHYTAYVKKPDRGGGIRWYHADDSFVDEVSEKTVLKQKNVYVLFYCRKEVKLELPSPPPRSNMSASEATKVCHARAQARASSISSNDGAEISIHDEERHRQEESTNRDLIHIPEVAPKSVGKSPKAARGQVYALSPQTSLSSIKQSNMVEQSPSSSSTSSSTSLSSSSESDTSSELSSGGLLDVKKSLDAMLEKTAKGNSSQGAACTESTVPRKQLGEGSQSSCMNKKGSKVIGSESSDSGSNDSSSSDSESGTESGEDTPKQDDLALVLGHPTEDNKGTELRNGRDVRDRVEKGKKVVLNHDRQGGNIEVVMRKRHKMTAWKPNALSSSTKGQNNELLGNFSVGRWEQDDDSNSNEASPLMRNEKQALLRSAAVKEIEINAKQRKRRMNLDRWDAMLDEGKRKKMKKKDSPEHGAKVPTFNRFHRIQSSMQKMNRGRVKGHHVRNSGATGGNRFSAKNTASKNNMRGGRK